MSPLALLVGMIFGQAAPAPTIEAGQLSKPPTQTKFVTADYPKEAFAQGIEADVVLLLDIDEQGQVSGAAVLEPAQPGDMGFDEAAVAAALSFEFEPAELDGKPIAIQISYRYRFIIEKKPVVLDETQPRAPVVNVGGLLLERGTRKALPGVLVTIFRDERGEAIGFETTSDAEGRFAFADLEEGAWKVLIEIPAYLPFRTTEEVKAGERLDLTYYLERTSYNPFDVRVTAERPRKEVNRTSLDAAAIEKIPGAAGDPLAVVQNFAGVARAPLGSGALIVRGSAPQDSQIFIDGIEVPTVYHFGGLRSVLPLGMLDGIDFYPGNFAVDFGRATGGMLDVRTRKLSPEKVGGYIDVSLLDTSIYLEAPIGSKAAIAVGGRRSYIDGVLKAAMPSDTGVNLVVAPRYYDYQLIASYRPAPAHDLKALFFGSDDQVRLLFDNPTTLSTQAESGNLSTSSRFYRTILSHRYAPSTALSNDLRVASGRDHIKFSIGSLMLDIDSYQAQVRDTFSFAFTDALTVKAGTDITFTKTDAKFALPRPQKEGEPPANADLDNLIRVQREGLGFWSTAAFAEVEATPISGLVVTPGLRFDYFERTHAKRLAPRLTVRYGLADHLTLKGAVGVYYQEPFFDETDPLFGNPDLKPFRALHYAIGTDWRPQPFLLVDVTGFYKSLDSLTRRTSAVVETPAGPRPLIYDNGGSGRVYGIDVTVRHELSSNVFGWIAYTLSKAQRRDGGAHGYRLFDYDQTHILTVIGTYKLPRNWEVGTRWRLVSGNPTTPVTGATFNADTDQYDPVYGSVNSARVPPFHQLDIRLDKRWIYDTWTLNAYLDLQNVYNRPNPEGRSYNFDYSRYRLQQGLPILTIVGLKAEL